MVPWEKKCVAQGNRSLIVWSRDGIGDRGSGTKGSRVPLQGKDLAQARSAKHLALLTSLRDVDIRAACVDHRAVPVFSA